MNPNTINPYTTQGASLSNLDQYLSQIVNAPTPVVNQTYGNLQNAAYNMQGGQGQYTNQIGNQNQQQLTNPLYSQMGNMQNLFNLYLADQGLAGKYQGITGGTGSVSPYQNPQLLASSAQAGQGIQGQNQADMSKVGQMTTPNQSNTLGAPTSQSPTNNPYLGSPSDIVNSASNAPQAPSVTTAEMAQPLVGGADMISLINSLIGQQSNVASNVTQQDVARYTDQSNQLQSLANALGNELNKRTNSTPIDTSGYLLGSKADAASNLTTAIANVQSQKGGLGSEYDLFQYLNQNQDLWKAQGINMDDVWGLYHQMFGANKDQLLSGGKTKATGIKQTTNKTTTKTFKDAKTGIEYTYQIDAKGNPTNVKPVNPSQGSGNPIMDLINSIMNFGSNKSQNTAKPPSQLVNSVKSKLKKEGYTDAQISEYLRTKGVQ